MPLLLWKSRGAVADGRLACGAALAFLSLELALLLLAFVPLYPHLVLRADKGGMLGIPHFAENPRRKATLTTWPFNEYVVPASQPGAEAFAVEAVIGDYLYLLLSDAHGEKVGLRASVEDALPGILVHLDGDRVISRAPLPQPTLERDRVHRIAGWCDGSRLHLAVDGGEVGTLPAPEGSHRWILASGLRGTVILHTGMGPNMESVRWVNPWRYKLVALVPVWGLIFAFFALLGSGLGRRGRWLVAAASAAGAYALWQPSSILLVALAVLALVLLGAFARHAVRNIRALVTRQDRRATLRRTVMLSALFGAAVGLLVLLRVVGTRDERGAARIDEPRAVCPVDIPAAGAGGHGLPRVVVIGSSTAIGEGLSDPERESFAGVLAGMLAGRARVELHARRGAPIARLMPLAEEALAEPADVVVFYSTFNDAMFTHGSLGESLLLGKVYDLYRLSYDTSDYMTKNHAEYGPAYEERVRAFVRRAKAAGARVLLVGELGADHVLYPRHPHGFDLFYESLARVAAEEGEAFADVSPEIRAHADDILFIDAMHVNARGHCLLARCILPHLLRLLPGRVEAP